MYIIVGLGNPGEDYVGTRHNVGFDVLEKIQQSKSEIPNNIEFSSFQTNNSLKAEIGKGSIGAIPVVLVKPLTFMNHSGVAVRKLVSEYHIAISDGLIVVHDDITMDIGRIKISKDSGAGKHNGVQSIIDHLKTKEFIRVRIGVGRGEGDIKDVVLSRFKPHEQTVMSHATVKAADACISLVKEGLEKSMNGYNQSL